MGLFELIAALALGGVVLVVIPSIVLWKLGKLREALDEIPALDDLAEDLADWYDEKFDELKKLLDELKGKIGQ